VKLIASFLLCVACFAQAELTLEQAEQRSGADFSPTAEGREVQVRGQVISKAVWALDSYYLPIEDKAEYGLLMQGSLSQLDAFQPGEWVIATGVIVRRGGLPVLQPKQIRKDGWETPPPAKHVAIGDLINIRYLGIIVSTEGKVSGIGVNGGGDVITLTDRESQVTVFLPRTRRDGGVNSFRRLSVGDTIRVQGIASQYCPLPPYDRYFQVLINDPSAIAMVHRGALIPPFLFLTAVGGLTLILAVWWLREHRMAAQRKTMRSLNSLSEEIIASSCPSEILKKLANVMPQISGATSVRLYAYNRRTRMLDRVASSRDPEPLAVNIVTPVGPLPTGAALAFRNRTLLNIPDTRRSPFFKAGSKELPRSVMFVPMFAQNEVMGVLEVAHGEGIRYFTHEEQAATQHLANQVATSLKLQEQQSMREQLFRSEKLAATGQLISGVASELRSPLEAILGISKKLITRPEEVTHERDLQVLCAEAQRAAEIVARLVSFGKAEESEAKAVEINGLLTSLVRFREREWKSLGIGVKARISRDPLYTLGAQGQLEQVFLNLLVHAEQFVLDTTDKLITLDSSAMGRRLRVEIGYSVKNSESIVDPLLNQTTDSSALGLGVSRGVVHSHGGDIRFSKPSARQCRFEVDLPLSTGTEARNADGTRRPRTRQYTTMVVEPDAALCRQIVAVLSARDHRVVPVASAEEGVDLVQRLRFDAVLCSMRLPGLNWVEFFERVREQANAFVLLTDGYDPALTRAFSGAEGFVLSKPLNENELDRVLSEVEERADHGVVSTSRRG
jgi:signal transduction histidine kinase/CheY-like chemotaxis protein